MRITLRGSQSLYPLAISLVLVSCGSDKSTAPANDPLYPTTVFALESEELLVKRARFTELNPRISSGLDRFGFTWGHCTVGSIPLKDEDTGSLIELAKETLVANRDFTGITSAAGLEVEKWFRDDLLMIDFELQAYMELQVELSWIRVWMDSTGVRSIRGYHFPEIHLPRARVSGADAQARLIGFEIPWYDFGGNEHIFTVAAGDLVADPVKVILPMHSRDKIELLVVWRVPILDEPRWYVFIDTVSGEPVHTRPLFVA